MRHQRPGRREQTGPLLGADVHHADPRQLQAVQQRAMGRIDEQYLAVGTHDVFDQRRAATGVVDTAQHVSAERCRRHRGEHVGGVAQQRTDVQRTLGIGDADQCGGGRRRVRQMLTPGPHPIAVSHRRSSVATT